MTQRLTSHAVFAKAIRIVLVFALVFWGSLRVESLAFGAVVVDSGAGHEDGALIDLQVLKVTSIEDELRGQHVRSAGETAQGSSFSALNLSAANGTMRLAAVPTWKDAASDDDAVLADFVTWKVDKPECADISVSQGVATLAGKAAGTVTVTCSLKDGAARYVSPDFAERYRGKAFEVSFTVDVMQPYVSSIEILLPNGTACLSGQEISLTEQERAEYAFGARVRVTDSVTGDALAEYTSEAGSLAEASGGLLTDFAWELQAADGSGNAPSQDVASIGADGVLRMTADGAFAVRCSTSLGGAVAAATVNVKSGSPQGEGGGEAPGDESGEDDAQGPAHPQETLRVIAELAAGEDAPDGPDGSAPPASPDSAESPTADGDGTAAEPSGESPDQPGDAPDASDASAPAGAAGSVIDKTYTADELMALASGTDTYTMYGSGGFVTVTGSGPYLAALLADAGIQDTSQIESITFQDYRQISTTVSWADLTAERYYLPDAAQGDYAQAVPVSPMVAVSSYVHAEPSSDEPGQGGRAADREPAQGADGEAGPSDDPAASESAESADAAPSGEPPSTDLVPNTRFRILFGSTVPPTASIDPDALRYVNTIRVNVKGAHDDEPADPTLKVHVEYVPVPLNATAVLSAIPNTEVSGARFGFQWQESTDDGATWTDVPNGAVQTLRKLTSEENLGKQYRVVLETNLVNEETGEYRTATSDPVTLQVGDGFAVVLAYDPPVAGETAIFQSSVLGDVDASQVEYIWEESEDGGETWLVIPGRTGPSLAVPTNPVTSEPADDSASGAGDGSGGDSADGAAPIIYIRVRAIAPDDRVAISNAQPLTVRVGDEDSDGDSGQDPSGQPTADPTADPDATPPVAPADPQTPAPQPSVTVTEISNITVETAAPTTTPTDTPAAPSTPQPAGAPSQIFINPQVSEQIVEQVEAQQDALVAQTPGQRWVALSTVEPSGDDVRRILADNPFAPLAAPLALGITAAGLVEKLVAFRRQL